MKTAALLATLVVCLRAQTFDAASIKHSAGGPGGRSGPGPRLQFSEGRVFGRNVTARTMILMAYDLTPYQLSGGPAWLDSDRWEVDAKSAAAAGRPELRRMLQALLAERFHLTLKRESREMPIFALVVGKGGFKLGGPNTPPNSGGGRGSALPEGGVMVDKLDMPSLAAMLSNDPRIGRPVIDKTAIQGTFLIRIVWESDDDFRSAVEEATGLKFESQKATLDAFTVETVEEPSEN